MLVTRKAESIKLREMIIYIPFLVRNVLMSCCNVFLQQECGPLCYICKLSAFNDFQCGLLIAYNEIGCFVV